MRNIFTTLILFAFLCNAEAQTIQVGFNNSTKLADDFFGFNGANFLRSDQPNYDTQWVIDSLATLSPNTIRYPAGLPSNYWDWKTGNFVKKLPEGWILPKDFGSISKVSDFNSILKMINDDALMTMFSINILSSSKEYQTAGIMFAKSLNLPIKYIEMGSELYLDRNNNSQQFPTAESYTLQANEWAAYIKSIPGFKNYKVAAVAAQQNNEPEFSRRNTWSSKVIAQLDSNVDAVTLHYYNSGRWNKNAVIPENAYVMLSVPFLQIVEEKSNFDLARAKGKEVWITEYNQYDRAHCVHDTWTHGLFLASQTLTFLEDTIVTKALCHTITTDARMGCLFTDSNSLIDFEDYKNDANCNVGAPYTRPHEKSAGGTAVSMVAKAMQTATTKRKLNFDSNTPIFPNGFQVVYGWQFDGPLSTEAIILNLDTTSKTIQFSKTAWDLTNGKFQQVYTGPGGPLEYIIGNPVLSPSNHELTISTVKTATQKLVLPPLSMTRVWVNKNAIIARVTNNTVANGTTTTLKAMGGSNYTWSGAKFNILKSDGSLVEFAKTNTANKTYNIVVTDISGLTTSTTLKVYAKPTVSISTTSTSLCRGASTNLTATLTGGNSANLKGFNWIPAEELTNANQATCIAKPSKTTTYTVYATDGLTYTAMDSVTIYVGPVADAGADTYIVSGQSIVLNAGSVNPGITYKWYLNNSFVANTTKVVTPLEKTTYKLIAKNTSNNCADTDYVTITPLISCSSAIDTLLTIPPNFTVKQFLARMKIYCTLTGHGVATDTSLSGLNDPIYFNGPFIINGHYTFIDCPYLYFSEGAYILQNTDNKNISFYNCSLLAAPCTGKMWRGIVMQEYGEKLVLSNCIISDAINGVEATNNARIFAYNTTFKRCYIGINFHDYEIIDLGGVIAGCKFIGSNCNKEPYLNKPRLAGIYCNNANYIQIGDAGLSPNKFNKSVYGIYSINTSVKAVNNVFTNMKTPSGEYLNTSSCIYVKNSAGTGNINNPLQLWPFYELILGDINPNSGNTFETSTNGVLIDNCAIVAEGNIFNDMTNPLYVNGSIYKEIILNNNKVIDCDYGFNLVDNKFATISVKGNLINIKPISNSTVYTYGIKIADAAGMSSNLKIEQNTITNKGIYGIWISNNHNGIVEANTVYMNQIISLNSYGIRLENSDSLKVNCNLVKGDNLTYFLNKRAISLSFSPFTSLECNITDITGTGFEFLADCNYASIKNNNFKQHKYGLIVGGLGLTNGVIGPQPPVTNLRPFGNVFEGAYKITSGSGKGKGYFSGAATFSIDSKIGGSLGTLKQFIVFNGDSLQIPYPNIKIGLSATSLTPTYNIKIPLECGAKCKEVAPSEKIQYAESLTREDITNLKELLAEELNESNDDATNYSMKVNLMKSTTNFDLVQKNTTNLVTFVNKNNNDNIIKLATIDKLYKLNDQLKEDNNFDVEKNINNLAGLVSQINPQTDYERNSKTVETIKLNFLLSKSLKYSESDLESLYQVANQCPYIGGPSVFDARAIYNIYNPNIGFNDFKLCETKLELAQTEKAIEKKDAVYFKVFPNPASNNVNLAFNLSDYSSATFEMIDITGRIVMSAILNTTDNFKTIELTNIESGMYTYNVIADNKPVAFEKISIIK